MRSPCKRASGRTVSSWKSLKMCQSARGSWLARWDASIAIDTQATSTPEVFEALLGIGFHRRRQLRTVEALCRHGLSQGL